MNVFVLNTKEDILKKVCNQAVLGHIVGKNTAVFPSFFRISSVVFRTNTLMDLLDDRIIIFGCTVPLNQIYRTNSV